jgi:Fe-S protein assembly co-chaperone HscB
LRRKLQRLTDYFALFEEPRRPWLDEEKLKSRFLVLSAEVHPDRVHDASAAEKQAAQDRYTTLNAAYNCLREPRSRLAHLLELERGAKPAAVQSVPADLMNLFAALSPALRGADSLITEKNAARSALMKVQIFGRAQPVLDELETLKQQLSSREAAASEEVRRIDKLWVDSTAPEKAEWLNHLEQLRNLLNYLAKWKTQVQERAFQITV